MARIHRTLWMALALLALAQLGAQAQQITDPAKKRKIITAVRERYYDARKATARGLHATLRASVPERPKSSEGAMRRLEERLDSAIAAIPFYLSIPAGGEPELTPSGNSDQVTNGDPDLVTSNAISSIQQMFGNALLIWLTTIDDGALPSAGADCKVYKEKKGYRLVFGPADQPIQATLTDDYTVTKVEVPVDGETMTMVPAFKPSPKGLLLDRITIQSGRAIGMDVFYEHQVIEGEYLPTRITVRANLGPQARALVVPVTISGYTFEK